MRRGKVLNPETGRYVKPSGSIGKKISTPSGSISTPSNWQQCWGDKDVEVCLPITCEHLDYIVGKRLSKQGAQSVTFKACEISTEDCKFIVKVLIGYGDNPIVTPEDLIRESENQNIAAKYEISPRVHQAFFCKDAHINLHKKFGKKVHSVGIIVMDAIKGNYFDDEDSDQIAQLISIHKKLNKIGLAHGDLDIPNILVDDNGKIWLIDWGSSATKKQDRYIKAQERDNDFIEDLTL